LTIEKADMDWKELKTKAVFAALGRYEDLHHNTRNPQHAWAAWQLARRMNVPVPEWVLRFVDKFGASEITKRSRKTDTADRFEAALTDMGAAVASHRRRRKIRKVGKQFGVDVRISRRDRPNLSAIARAAAAANGVSVNRLLTRYRASTEPTKR
jgi:hypothetical protein